MRTVVPYVPKTDLAGRVARLLGRYGWTPADLALQLHQEGVSLEELGAAFNANGIRARYLQAPRVLYIAGYIVASLPGPDLILRRFLFEVIQI